MKRQFSVLLVVAALVAACEKPAEKKVVPPTLITVVQAQATLLETSEQTLGSLEAVGDPRIAAEVAGRVVEIAARAGQAMKRGQLLARLDPADAGNQARVDVAETARLEALLAQQERVVARQTELAGKNFISKNAVEDATAQRDALKSQLAAARSRGALSGNNLRKTRIVAPFDGVVEEQVSAVGDYVKVGDPVFRLVSNERLRVHLPFPETAAPRLKVGQRVRLGSPMAPQTIIEGVVEDIRPSVTESSRAVDVIARIDNPGALRSGGSVNATVITGSKEGAIVVPEQSVVLRPAGKVVYVVAGGKAQQRVVEIGGKQGGQVEIVKGVAAGETVALDGAGFLTDGAAVMVKETPTKPQAPAAGQPAAPAK